MSIISSFQKHLIQSNVYELRFNTKIVCFYSAEARKTLPETALSEISTRPSESISHFSLLSDAFSKHGDAENPNNLNEYLKTYETI